MRLFLALLLCCGAVVVTGCGPSDTPSDPSKAAVSEAPHNQSRAADESRSATNPNGPGGVSAPRANREKSATRAASASSIHRDPSSLRTLQLGDCGVDVKHVNENLVESHFLPRGFASSCFDLETYHGVLAFQKWYGYGRTGEVPGELRENIRNKPAPRLNKPVKSSKIIVSLSKQTLVEVRKGRIQRIIDVSTAAPGYSTPAGTFSVYRKEEMSWSVPYKVWLPYASYIYGGIAMHSYPDVPPYPASHGCIRIPEPFAKQLYRFAELGMTVNVV